MTVEPATALPAHAAEPKLLGLRLSIMMFLQWAMFGLWIPLAGLFLLSHDEGGLGFTQAQLGWILGISGSIGALAAPFIAGQIADRYFSTERLMAAMLIIGGCIWWWMTYQTAFWAWLALGIASASGAPSDGSPRRGASRGSTFSTTWAGSGSRRSSRASSIPM
jgi:MFS family permease